MGEKFSLKWNDFNSNVLKSVTLFRNEEYLQDVTLVTDDNHQVSAHKLVLSASSEYFKNIFQTNKHSHPLLCLGGIFSNDLDNILDFIYNGQVNIYQDHLDRFLEIAQRFKLEGLLGNQDPETDRADCSLDDSLDSKEFKEPQNGFSNVPKTRKINSESKDDNIELDEQSIVSVNSGDYSEIDEKLYENMEKREDGKYSCKLCDRVMQIKTRMREHVETHMDNLSFPCNYCDKICRSRPSLKMHTFRLHKL